MKARFHWLAISAILIASFLFALAAEAEEIPQYVRLALGANSSLLLQFKGPELRVASTEQGLNQADPIRAKEYSPNRIQFPEVPVTLDPSLLPGNPSKALLELFIFTYPTNRARKGGEEYITTVYANLTVSINDPKGATWNYTIRYDGSRIDLDDKSLRVATAPVMKLLPNTNKVTLKFTVKLEKGKARIGLTPMAGEASLNNLTRDGKSAPAALRVTDRDKNILVTEKGGLDKFGFT